MSMRAEHLAVGAGIGLLGALIRCTVRGVEPQLKHLALGAGVGAFGALVPDLLEPALHPGHRKVAHSLLAAAAIIKADGELLAHNRNEADGLTIAIEALLDGYLSHLGLDASTPAGLPVLGLGR